MARVLTQQSITDASTAVFQAYTRGGTDGPPAAQGKVTCDATSTYSLMVNIPAIHATVWITLAPGQSYPFGPIPNRWGATAGYVPQINAKCATASQTTLANLTIDA